MKKIFLLAVSALLFGTPFAFAQTTTTITTTVQHPNANRWHGSDNYMRTGSTNGDASLSSRQGRFESYSDRRNSSINGDGYDEGDRRRRYENDRYDNNRYNYSRYQDAQNRYDHSRGEFENRSNNQRLGNNNGSRQNLLRGSNHRDSGDTTIINNNNTVTTTTTGDTTMTP